MSSLEKFALDAVSNHPNSHVEIAIEFVSKACPAFLSEDNERLVKVGRNIESSVTLKEKKKAFDLEAALACLVQECTALAGKSIKVPKARFGKTELMISRLTLGCMRFQQAWGPRVKNMNMVDADCQDNLVRILKRAILDFGINHIETAKGYGCSELQLGVALKQLFDTGLVKREDLIIQTKIPACATAKELREFLDGSLKRLKLDYIDLFSFHGLNMLSHYDLLFNNGENGNNIDVIHEYVKAGKIKHVGFSTHGPEDTIRKFIETDEFEYVNLHYHYFGSYTTSGVGKSAGNLDNVKLLQEKDMGVFIISAYDKGGKLYEPSNQLRSLTLPEMEPIAFGTNWMWTHEHHMGSPIHTCVVGAARPSDLDQGAVSAYLCGQDPEGTLAKVNAVVERLEKAKEDALGKEWIQSCFEGVPKSRDSKYTVEHNQIIWCYNLIKAFGMLEFAKNRYGSLEGNRAQWDNKLSVEENIDKRGRGMWGFVPGLSIDPTQDYSDDLANVPPENIEKVKEAEVFVHKYCKKEPPKQKDAKKEEELEIPFDWQSAYQMKTWTDFPDRPMP